MSYRAGVSASRFGHGIRSHRAYTGDDEREVQTRIKVLDRSIQRGCERVGKQPRKILVLQSRLHITYDFLRQMSNSIYRRHWFLNELGSSTSTAELLKVLHSGVGRISGRCNGPSDGEP